MSFSSDFQDDDRDQLYTILNLSKSATSEDIREAHRKLTRLFHPDKHTLSQAQAQQANLRFQNIQHAFEVLSDKQKRMIYDTIGEEGLKAKLEVGPRNMTSDELKAFYLRQVQQAKADELDNLVQSRGDTTISVDCRSMFGGRVVLEQRRLPGSIAPIRAARPATWAERISDVNFTGLSLRNSWTIPFSVYNLPGNATEDGVVQTLDNESSVTLTGHATINGRRQATSFGFLASFRHQLSPKTSLETTLPLLTPFVLRSKVVHQYSNDVFMTMDLAGSTLSHPPDISVTTGRQMTPRGVLFGTLQTGPRWKLAGWGEHGDAASYIIGWTRNSVAQDPTGYTVELITGLRVLGIAADYNTLFKTSDIRLKLGGSATTSGLAATIIANRKVTQHSRLGAHVTVNGQNLVLRLTFSRLGQTFKLPVWIGDGLQLEPILYGLVVPLGCLIAYEFTVVQPRRQARKIKQTAQKEHLLKDKLLERQRVAKESVDLMSEAVIRKQAHARAHGGLYISEATYGTDTDRIDVSIALAAQVNGDQLVLAKGQRKSALLGFWNPAYGKKKTLKVNYAYRDRLHAIEVGDLEGLAIPSEYHIIQA